MSRPLDVRFGPGLSGLTVLFSPDPPKVPYDSFNEYLNGAVLDGLNDFTQWAQSPTGSFVTYWSGPYVDRQSGFNYILCSDTFNSYTSGVSLNGLSGGSTWTSSYVSR